MITGESSLRAQKREQTTGPVIEVSDVCKRYGGVHAVDRVCLSVSRAEIVAILGPNGAGKTTLIEMMEGLRSPDGGSVSLFGLDPYRNSRALRNRIGVQLQASSLPGAMTVWEAMVFFSTYHGVKPRPELLAGVRLEEKKASQCQTLSIGQQRRLALAIAVAHEPELLFLDEPTAGLDVQSRMELHGIMEELKAGGTTILLATHDMAEAEKLADRVAVMVRGKIAALGTPRELTAIGNRGTKISVATERACILDHAPAFPACTSPLLQQPYAVYFSTAPARSLTAILSYIESNKDSLIDLRVERPTLEERFMELTAAGE
jgi:ABC-2 type transport system ATP-binding protein